MGQDLGKRKPPSPCRHCTWAVKDQIFLDGAFEYSVAGALRILRDRPRKPATLHPGKAYEAMLNSTIVARHLPHVDIAFPAIAAVRPVGYLFIDGNHRVWKRLMKRLPVKAYILTPAEQDQIRKRVKT